MYCGCRTARGKCTWCFTILFLLAAAIGLALGLYYTVPCSRTLTHCQAMRGMTGTNGTITDSNCWGNYWKCTSGANGHAPGLYFWLAVAGAACLLLSLLSCCCFCCQRSPRKPVKAHQGQFIQGTGTTTTAPTYATTSHDTAVYSDQHSAPYYPPVKGSVAHV